MRRAAFLIPGFSAVLPSAQLTAQILFKPDETPEPHSIDELRKVSNLTRLDLCSFPAVTAADKPTTLRPLAGDLELQLPGDWAQQPSDTVKTVVHEPELIYQSATEAKVSIARVPSGVSRSYMADPATLKPLPANDCEVISGSSGVIWTLYPPEMRPGGGDVRPRFVAFGDAVTSHGQRYRFRIGSWSAEELDSLAAHISSAVTRQ
jgi:hypothetical protein